MHVRAGKGQRENSKQAPCWVWSRTLSLALNTWRSWPELKSRIRCLTNLSHPGPPKKEDFFFLMFIYFWERESTSKRGPEETQNLKQAPRLWAVSTEPDVGLELTNCEIMTWAGVRCPTDWATQAPQERKTFKEKLLIHTICSFKLIFTYLC